MVFGQIVLLSTVLGGLVLLIKRALTRPVHALVKTMRQVDEQRDLTCRTELGAEDELGTVGRAFNHLLGSIQHTFSEVWGGSERQPRQLTVGPRPPAGWRVGPSKTRRWRRRLLRWKKSAPASKKSSGMAERLDLGIRAVCTN